MLKSPLIAALFVTLTAALPANAAGCRGADPALSPVTVTGVTTDAGNNVYHVSGTVTNTGSMKQASNVLQFVDIYRDREKMDNIGIPPLRPGQSYTYHWSFKRSQDAGEDTTRLHFRLRMVQPSGSSRQNCNTADDSAVVQF